MRPSQPASASAAEHDVLGAHDDLHAAALLLRRAVPLRHEERAVPGSDRDVPVLAAEHLAGDEVGGADERRDELGGRPRVHVARAAELLDLPGPHHGDDVGEGERLALVVRHVEGRHADLALDPLQLGAHLLPEPRVEVRERLVEEEERRLERQRAGESQTLLLAAREVRRAPLAEVAEPHDLERALDALAASPRAGRRRRGAADSGNATFSRTVMCGQIAYDWKTIPSRRSLAETPSRPGVEERAAAHGTAPASGRSSPAMQRRVVVFPQPDGPSSERNAPSSIVNDTPRTASTEPKDFRRPATPSITGLLRASTRPARRGRARGPRARAQVPRTRSRAPRGHGTTPPRTAPRA